MRQLSALAIIVILIAQPIFLTENADSTGPAEAPAYDDPTISDLQQKSIPELEMQEKARDLLAQAPLAFTENRGQLDNDEVRFYVQGGSLWFTDDGVWFDIYEEEPLEKGGESAAGGSVNHQRASPQDPYVELEPQPVRRKGVILKQEFVGCNEVVPEGADDAGWYSNYFIGNDTDGWRSRVPNWHEVWYRGLWDGIDLRYYTTGEGLKYDFIVAPGADPDDIRIRYDGADSVIPDGAGGLVIRTSVGDVTDSELFIYQSVGDEVMEVAGSFAVDDSGTVGLSLDGGYDRGSTLVIDPLISYGTYLGGTGSDNAYCMHIDGNGTAYIMGQTSSTSFPVTVGAYQTTHGGGSNDAYILKLNGMGTSIVWCSFLGGNGVELYSAGGGLGDIKVDEHGYVVVAGGTDSSNFPTTSGAYDTTHNSARDVFVCKFSPSGASLLKSTYIGGSGHDFAQGLTLDALGNVFVTGPVKSSDFPTTAGAYDSSLGGPSDAFIVRLNRTWSTLDWSTYFGGSGTDRGSNVELDKSGTLCMMGHAPASIPTTAGAYDTTFNGGFDMFFTKWTPNGTTLLYSTYVGGSSDENAMFMVLGPDDDAYVTGRTESSNYPTTVGAYDTSKSTGEDVFVCRLDPSGNGAQDLVYSTFIGASGQDRGQGIGVTPTGEAIVVGKTTSSGFPTTLDANQTVHGGGYDGFISVLTPSGASLNYSTYIGGASSDSIWDVWVVDNDNFYVTGEAVSTTLPTTTGAYSTTNPGSNSAFALRFGYFNMTINITQLNSGHLPITYARYQWQYGFRVLIHDSVSLNDVSSVRLTLDPGGSNIVLNWNRASNKFTEVLDPFDYVEPHWTSNAQWGHPTWKNNWYVYFNVTFNWTYPDENLNSMSVRVLSEMAGYQYGGATGIYQVENDLVFTGDLEVVGPTGVLNDGDMVGPEAGLNWDGLTVVYQGTTDIYPPDKEYNVSLSNEEGNIFLTSTAEGEAIDMGTLAPNSTDMDGDTHVFNITVIPDFCDKSSDTFTLFVDDVNITYRNPLPSENVWQTSSDVTIGVTIDDVGGGMVDGDAVLVRTSHDNGTTWGGWNTWTQPTLAVVDAEAVVELEDGWSNCVQWSARDTFGNGPDLSPAYRVLVDTVGPEFSDFSPAASAVSYEEKVWVIVNVTDKNSGVNPYTIEYSVSTDAGVTWDEWEEPEWKEYGVVVVASEDIVFPNGTANRIRWRASDIAGNVAVSEPQPVNVDLWVQTALRTVLSTPADGALLTETSSRLEWSLRIPGLTGVSYDVYLDTVNPPQDIFAVVYDAPWMAMVNLMDKTTYYWTVIPRYAGLVGTCDSGVWSFSYDKDYVVPEGRLVTPYDGATVTGKSVDLSWEPVGDGTGWTWDIYLDYQDPPVEPLELKSFDLTANVQDLEDNVTYHWMAVPSRGPYTGVCISGVWSFTFRAELEVPRVALISPEDGAAVKADPLTLEWEPRTEGTGEGWTYDVHMSEGAEPGDRVTEGISETELLVETLEVGKMYSWTVVPTSAENVRGVFGKVIFSFNVTTGRPEDFGVAVDPVADVTLRAGGATQFMVNVTNTGVAGDDLGFALDTGLLGTQVALQSYSEEGIAPGEGAQVMVTISLLPDTSAGDFVITFTGRSLHAEGLGFDVSDSVTFTVRVTVAETVTPPDEKESGNTLLWAGLIAAIIAIIAIVVLILVMKRNKKKKEDEEAEAARATTPVVAGEIVTKRAGAQPLRATPVDTVDVPVGLPAPVSPAPRLTTPVPAVATQLAGAAKGPELLLPKAPAEVVAAGGGQAASVPPPPPRPVAPGGPQGPPSPPV